MTAFESVVEEAAIQWLEGLGYAYRSSPDIAHDAAEAPSTHRAKSRVTYPRPENG